MQVRNLFKPGKQEIRDTPLVGHFGKRNNPVGSLGQTHWHGENIKRKRPRMPEMKNDAYAN
jgi:hypothetical protein